VQIALSEHAFHGPAAERFTPVRQLQVDGVELRFGPYDFERHPLWQPGGPCWLRAQAQLAGVALPSVYGGYFHAYPLSVPDAAARQRHSQVLDRLVDACAEAGVAVLVLPLLGAGEPSGETTCQLLEEMLLPILPRALTCGLTLALETLLPVPEVRGLLERLHSPMVRVAYDVGNAAVLGYDAIADCQRLGETLAQVRVKDCSADGQRVPLGQGMVALPALVQSQRHFSGWWVLETSPGTELSLSTEVAFLRQLLTTGGIN